MTNLVCACKGCNNRTEGCHASCADYAEYRAECDRILKAKYDDYAANAPHIVTPSVAKYRRETHYKMGRRFSCN